MAKTVKKPIKKSTKKKKTNKKKNQKLSSQLWKLILPIITGIAILLGITTVIKISEDKITLEIEYADNSSEPLYNDLGGEYEEQIATVESIDGGGLFKDNLSGDLNDPELYYELGSIEEVDTSSPEAFKKSTLGRCIVANNVYGAQCVSLARAFWWSYAGFDVSTCGTGLAKGMMNCADDNAKDKFKTIWDKNEIQEGTWIVLDGKTTGHICMALSNPINGYVTCLGENQGGVPCEYGVGGAGTNIINISLKDFIGGYTPLDYIEPEPVPEPELEPLSPDTGILK